MNALLFLTFLVMLFSNITAWYFRIGIRVGYYVVPLMLWLAAVSLHLLSSRLTVPRSISSLIVLRGLWMACIVLTAPLVLLDQSPEAFEILGKGAAEELVISIALTLMMLLVTQLDGVQRRRLLDLYLLGAALLAFLSLAQVVGPVVFGFDVDAWVSSVLRQGSRPAVSLAEDSMGILGATLFRMRGTTSDPNVNGLIFALALPVVYLRARERSAVGMTLLMVLFATVIVGTISTTMISAATLTIAAMTARSLARPGSRAMGAAGLAAVLVAGAMLWQSKAETIRLLYEAKTSGNVSSHATIAGATFDLWRDHPLGIGYNQFSRHSEYFSAHNSYLQVLAELGPVGLLVLLATLAAWVNVGLRSRNEVGSTVVWCAGILSWGSMGHHVFYRLEFQLVMAVLVSMAATGGLEPLPRVVGGGGAERASPLSRTGGAAAVASAPH